MIRNIIHFLVLFCFGKYRHPKNTGTTLSGSVSKVLIGISSGIGDAIMAEPLIRALKEFNPDTTIHVLASPSTRTLFEKHPHVHKVFAFRPQLTKMAALWWQMRKIRYDLYIGAIPSNTLLQLFIPFMSEIPFRIKHRTPHTGSRNYDFLFDRIEPIPEGRHRIECNLDLLKHAGVTNTLSGIRPDIFLPDESVENAKGMLQKKRYAGNKLTIGFHPGCNPQAAFKRWAPENYAQLMKYLFDEWHAQVLIVGGKDEVEDVRKIEVLFKGSALNFVGQAGLFETAALIKHCRFFVSNDSGIMHLATAVHVPVFAIFGPKDERHIGPYGSEHTVIRNGTEVGNVTVDQVIEALLQSEKGLKGIKAT